MGHLKQARPSVPPAADSAGRENMPRTVNSPAKVVAAAKKSSARRMKKGRMQRVKGHFVADDEEKGGGGDSRRRIGEGQSVSLHVGPDHPTARPTPHTFTHDLPDTHVPVKDG